jgi:hypothetical protein
VEERLQWVKHMRSLFSPKGMCGPDGEVDQDFFKPKNIIIRLKDDEKWGAPQREALYKVVPAAHIASPVGWVVPTHLASPCATFAHNACRAWRTLAWASGER